ncbi:MAG: hypothetical protein V4485_02905 [Pseudomonadota bacterium]
MKSTIRTIVAYLLFTLGAGFAAAEDNIIRNIYIESSGNNPIEAQLKANEIGMRRALQLLADKMNIKDTDLHHASYQELIQVFQISTLRDKVESAENYSAVVDYHYNRKNAQELIKQYAPEASDAASYDYLVIPLFKRNNVVTLWSNDVLWLKNWNDIRSLLYDYKLLYPDPADIKPRSTGDDITAANVLSLSYQDFLNIFPNYFIDRVLLVIGEYFTHPDDGKAYFKIKYIQLGEDKTTNTDSKNYYIQDKASMPNIFKRSIEDTVKEFGQKRSGITTAEFSAKRSLKDQAKDPGTGDLSLYANPPNIHAYVMQAEIFDPETLTNLRKKLDKANEVRAYTVINEEEENYKVTIYSTFSLEDLTRGLYLEGLGYVKDGTQYKLIEIMHGI